MVLDNSYEVENVADKKKMLWRSFHFRVGRQIASGGGEHGKSQMGTGQGIGEGRGEGRLCSLRVISTLGHVNQLLQGRL